MCADCASRETIPVPRTILPFRPIGADGTAVGPYGSGHGPAADSRSGSVLVRPPARPVGTVHPVRQVPAVPPPASPMSGGQDRPAWGGGGSGGGRGTGARTRAGDAGRLPGTLLRRRAGRSPHTVPALPYPSAAVTGTAGCSFAELDRRARAVAARLGTLLAPGARVLLAYPQGPDLAGAFFGCLYAGMAAVPLVLPSPGATDAVGRAVRRCEPDLVLTGSDGWTALAVDRARTQVMEADGIRVAGDPVWRLAQNWRPVGVLRSAPAYHRYYDDGMAGGRMEPAMGHADLADVMGELAQAIRLGTDEENVGWIAAVHGVEDAIWRILLPVRITL